MERSKVENVIAEEAQECDEYGRGKGKIFYTFHDLDIGKQVECNGAAFQIMYVDSDSKKIVDGIAAVGGTWRDLMGYLI